MQKPVSGLCLAACGGPGVELPWNATAKKRRPAGRHAVPYSGQGMLPNAPVSTAHRGWCPDSEQLFWGWGRDPALPWLPARCLPPPWQSCHQDMARPANPESTGCYRRGRHLASAHIDSLGGCRQSRNVGSAASRLRAGLAATGEAAEGGAVPFSCRSVSPSLSKTPRAALSAVATASEPLAVKRHGLHISDSTWCWAEHGAVTKAYSLYYPARRVDRGPTWHSIAPAKLLVAIPFGELADTA